MKEFDVVLPLTNVVPRSQFAWRLAVGDLDSWLSFERAALIHYTVPEGNKSLVNIAAIHVTIIGTLSFLSFIDNTRIYPLKLRHCNPDMCVWVVKIRLIIAVTHTT